MFRALGLKDVGVLGCAVVFGAQAFLPAGFGVSLDPWTCEGPLHGGALMITYTIVGVPCSNYSIRGPKTLF